MDNSLCMNDQTLPVTPEKYCQPQQAESPCRSAWEFFRQSKTAPDQLRMRMAHVWHQIFVDRQRRRLRDLRARRVPAAAARRRVRHVREPARQVRAVAAARPLPELGQERPGARRHPAQRELRARADAALHDRRQRAERRRHAEARREGAARSPTYAQADIETLARVLTGYTFPDAARRDRGLLGQPELLHRRHDPVRRVSRHGREDRARRAHQLRPGRQRGDRGARRHQGARRPPEHAAVHRRSS